MAWAPAYGEDRRKDYPRAQARARSLRKNETPHEKRLWKLLRQLNREGANFRRQANIGNRVFDFADLGRRVLIELDGAVHELPGAREVDKEKEIDAILRGYRVVRITNAELATDSGAVMRRIQTIISRSSPQRGEGREGGRAEGTAVAPLAVPPARPLPPAPRPQGRGNEDGA